MSVKEVPWWGIASSALAPAVLAAGWMIGASVQSRPYDPVADTVSALAGAGATDRWVMTLAFALAGVCEVVTGLALRPARAAGRAILIAGGVAGVLVASYPVRMGVGAPPGHILWAVTGLTALAVWPLAAARRGRDVPSLLRPEAALPATVLLVAMLALFGVELAVSAGQAGLAERVLGEAQSAWPFAVAMSCGHPVRVKPRSRPVRGYRVTGG